MTSPVIDAHSHLYPRSYVELLKARDRLPRIVGEQGDERFIIFANEEGPGGTGGRPIDPTYWDLGEKLAFMDRHGIDRSVVGLGNPWLDPIEGPEAVAAARALNEEFASMEKETNGRVGGLGVLPQHDVAEAAEVAGEVAEHPALYGVANGTRLCGRFLDNPGLDPVWGTLEATGSPFLIHPHYGIPLPEFAGATTMYPLALGFPFETSVAVSRLIMGGGLQRFPRLRVVAAHGGGTLPYLAGRLDAVWRSDAATRRLLPVPPSEELAKLALDAVVYAPRALRAAADLAGVDRLMFGTDHPFTVADPQANLAAIDEALDEGGRRLVRGDAALAYFGLPPWDASKPDRPA